MNAEAIRGWIERRPFQPFVVKLAGGESHRVRHPESVIYVLVDYFGGVYMRRCPKCGGGVKNVGGGFYDGPFPQPAEVLIYVLALAVPIVQKAFLPKLAQFG